MGRLLSLSDWPFHSSPFAQGLCSRVITTPSSLLHPDPPQCTASGTLAFSFRPRRTPVPTISRWGDGTTGSRVPHKSQHHVLAPFTPDTAWPRARQLARLIRGMGPAPRSDVIWSLRRVIGRFAFAQLRGAYLTRVPVPFPATLKTPTLNRRPLQWFGIPLSQSWSRRARSGPSAPSSISRTALLCWLQRCYVTSHLHILGTRTPSCCCLARFRQVGSSGCTRRDGQEAGPPVCRSM